MTTSVMKHLSVARLIESEQVAVKRRRCDPWAEYERGKRQIAAMNLSPDEYEQAIRRLCEALGI